MRSTFKQKNLGAFVGGLRIQAARSMFYMSIWSLFFTSSAAYSQIQSWFPFVNYWMIAGGVAVSYVFIMFIEHKFIYKSEITYSSHTAFGEHNPTTVLMLEMQKEIRELRKKIDEKP